jgi:hypothetical protein
MHLFVYLLVGKKRRYHYVKRHLFTLPLIDINAHEEKKENTHGHAGNQDDDIRISFVDGTFVKQMTYVMETVLVYSAVNWYRIYAIDRWQYPKVCQVYVHYATTYFEHVHNDVALVRLML